MLFQRAWYFGYSDQSSELNAENKAYACLFTVLLIHVVSEIDNGEGRLIKRRLAEVPDKKSQGLALTILLDCYRASAVITILWPKEANRTKQRITGRDRIKSIATSTTQTQSQIDSSSHDNIRHYIYGETFGENASFDSQRRIETPGSYLMMKSSLRQN